MTPEDRSLLERTYKLAEENNEIIKSIRRTARFGMVMRVLYWTVIVGLSIGAFYFIQPYIEFMTSTLGIGGNTESLEGGANNSSGLLNTLEELLK